MLFVGFESQKLSENTYGEPIITTLCPKVSYPTMHFYRYISHLKERSWKPRVVTVGAYDGVHLGHQEILRQLAVEGKKIGVPTLVLSFEPIPREFFSPDKPAARLTRFRERYELLNGFGVDEFFCPRFDSLRDLSPEEFIKDILLAGLNARHIVVGHDFRFAAERLGTLDDLKTAGINCGFGVTEVSAVYQENQRVSSTAIRNALKAGDLKMARAMLGREYSMSGRVVRGIGLGKQLGFPTANVNLNRRQAPVDGIFAARVTGLAEGPLEGVASIGTRPTVGGVEPLLEVFVFDFDRDIYGEYITVHFVERLREERKYPDLGKMTRQMHKDVADARSVLAA